LDDGTPDRANFIVMAAENGVLAIDYRAGVWHTFFALEPDSVIFEVKPGPYDAHTDKEFAPWSPAEGTPEGRSYIADLEDQLRKACGIGAREWTP
jgi:hypothetical protein